MMIDLRKRWERLIAQMYDENNLIINWSNFNKALLLSVLGAVITIAQIKWYIFSFYSENKIWLNEDYFEYRLTSLILIFLIYLLILIVGFYFKQSNKIKQFIGYFAPIFFSISMLYGGYTIGIYSPTTMAGVVNFILVGLVLYHRKLIISIACPVIIALFWVGFKTHTKELPYAPLFSDSLNNSAVYESTFWVLSMLELYLPILFGSAILFEILLMQWRRREKNIKIMSQTDPLTNVYNRRYISDQLTQFEASKNYIVVLLDLDHFKNVNDQYGHEAGDIVLKQVANILKKSVRHEDIVGRFGGEEFILILKNTDLEHAQEITERCRLNIEKQQVIVNGNQVVRLSASFGIAVAQDIKTKEEVTRCADEALYRAKQHGRNRVSIYNSHLIPN